jgi:hypothetical protein
MADKAGKAGGESHMSRAVSQFMMPVAIAWLLAAGGLLAWNMPLTELLKRIGQLAIFAGTATAFLTVVLALVEDAVPGGVKRRLIFPLRPHGHPSYAALDPFILDRAEIQASEIPDLEALRDDPARLQRLWWAAYEAHRGHPAIDHYAQRWIAWLQTAPLLVLLALIALATALIGPHLGPWIDGDHWLWFALGTGVLAWLGILSARGCAFELVAQVVKQMARPTPAPPGPTPSAPREDD